MAVVCRAGKNQNTYAYNEGMEEQLRQSRSNQVHGQTTDEVREEGRANSSGMIITAINETNDVKTRL